MTKDDIMVSKAINLRMQMEKEIANAVEKFELETDFRVDEINIMRGSHFASPKSPPINVVVINCRCLL